MLAIGEILEVDFFPPILFALIPGYCVCIFISLWQYRKMFTAKVMHSEHQVIVANKAKALMKAVAGSSSMKAEQGFRSVSVYFKQNQLVEDSWKIISEEIAHICSVNSEFVMIDERLETSLVLEVDLKSEVLLQLWDSIRLDNMLKKRIIFKTAVSLWRFDVSSLHKLDVREYDILPHNVEGLVISFLPSTLYLGHSGQIKIELSRRGTSSKVRNYVEHNGSSSAIANDDGESKDISKDQFDSQILLATQQNPHDFVSQARIRRISVSDAADSDGPNTLEKSQANSNNFSFVSL